MKKTKSKSDNYLSGIWRRHFFPVVIWLGIVGCIVILFKHRTQRIEVMGLVQGYEGEVAAVTTGRLKSVNVQLYDKVIEDQTLCQLDDQRVMAQLATSAVTIDRLKAEVVAARDQLKVEQTNLQNDWVADSRRFAINVEQARLRQMELAVDLETDKIILEDLKLDVKIVEELYLRQAISEFDVRKKQLARDTVQKRIDENTNLMAEATQVLQQALTRQKEFASRLPVQQTPDTALKPLQLAILEQNKMIEELHIDSAALTLKAPFAGVVKEILREPGDTVLPGEPILIIQKADQPSTIIAYVADEMANEMEKGIKVELITRTRPPLIERSEVEEVGPSVVQKPQRLWMNPTIPEYGRPFMVSIPEKWDKLVPGQSVGIRRVASNI